VSTATYDNRAAMQRSREQADAIRSAGSLETGAEVLQVCEIRTGPCSPTSPRNGL